MCVRWLLEGVALVAALTVAGGATAAEEDKVAGEAFKKIEQAIKGAKTVRVKYRLNIEAGGKTALEGSGTVLLKGKDRMNVALRTTADKRTRFGLIISDGKRVASANDDGEDWRSEDVLPRVRRNFKSGFAAALARSGFFLWSMALPIVSEDIKTEADLAKALRVSGFKAGTDGAARTLTYKLTVGAPGHEGDMRMGCDVKIWYDPKTLKLFRRTVTMRKRGDVAVTLTETYDEYVLDGDIPDEQFKLPADTRRGGAEPPPESRKR